MAISAARPTVVPAATYGLWAFTFRTIGDGCADTGTNDESPIAAEAILTKYRVRDDGVSERSPLSADTVRLSVPDLYALAGENPAVAAALQAIIAAVQSIAAAQNLI